GALRQGFRWEEFVALYGRLILSWGRRDFGLQESDAENLCQEVLIRVWRNINAYDPNRGRFRQWLYACTRNAFLNLRRDRRGEWVGNAMAGVDDPSPVPSRIRHADIRPTSEVAGLDEVLQALDDEGFALDGLQEAVAHVRQRVQPHTWKAFLLFEFFEMS